MVSARLVWLNNCRVWEKTYRKRKQDSWTVRELDDLRLMGQERVSIHLGTIFY